MTQNREPRPALDSGLSSLEILPMRRPILLHLSHDSQSPAGGMLPEGFDGVEWTIAPASMSQGRAATGAPPGSIRALAMDCPSLSVAESVEFVLQALDSAATLGAVVLNVAIPPVARAEGARFVGYGDALNFAHGLLQEARREAEARGVALAIVAPGRGSLLSPVELRELLDGAHSSAVGACVDLTAVARLGSIRDWVSTLGHRVQSLRLGDPVVGHAHDLYRALERVPLERPLILSNAQLPTVCALPPDIAQSPPTK